MTSPKPHYDEVDGPEEAARLFASRKRSSKPLSPEAEKFRKILRADRNLSSAGMRTIEHIAHLFDSHQSARIAALEDALQKCAEKFRDLNSNWDCDTGANASHPHYCRACAAKEFQEMCERVLKGEGNAE
jgi:thiaminase